MRTERGGRLLRRRNGKTERRGDGQDRESGSMGETKSVKDKNEILYKKI